VKDSWQTKIRVVEAAISRSAAAQETSQTIRNARVKQGKKAANNPMGVNVNRTNPVRAGLNREGRARIRINGPAVATIRTERADKPDFSRFGAINRRLAPRRHSFWVPAFSADRAYTITAAPQKTKNYSPPKAATYPHLSIP
jgi:hypothetical protein